MALKELQGCTICEAGQVQVLHTHLILPGTQFGTLVAIGPYRQKYYKDNTHPRAQYEMRCAECGRTKWVAVQQLRRPRCECGKRVPGLRICSWCHQEHPEASPTGQIHPSGRGLCPTCRSKYNNGHFPECRTNCRWRHRDGKTYCVNGLHEMVPANQWHYRPSPGAEMAIKCRQCDEQYRASADLSSRPPLRLVMQLSNWTPTMTEESEAEDERIRARKRDWRQKDKAEKGISYHTINCDLYCMLDHAASPDCVVCGQVMRRDVGRGMCGTCYSRWRTGAQCRTDLVSDEECATMHELQARGMGNTEIGRKVGRDRHVVARHLAVGDKACQHQRPRPVLSDTCSVDGCERARLAKGLCGRCYRREWMKAR